VRKLFRLIKIYAFLIPSVKPQAPWESSLANEGDAADIISAMVTAMLCSPPLCRYLSLNIIAWQWPLFQESIRNAPTPASCSIVYWSRSSPVVLKLLWAVGPFLVDPKGGRGPVWKTLVQPLQLQLGFLNYLLQLFRKLYSS